MKQDFLESNKIFTIFVLVNLLNDNIVFKFHILKQNNIIRSILIWKISKFG